MGTWGAGPFANDMAMDFVGSVVDRLMEPIDAFLECPLIDDTFDEAFAAVALLNGVMARSAARPWDREARAVREGAPIVAALIACFDEQIDGMEPDEAFKAEHRQALVDECERFAAFLR